MLCNSLVSYLGRSFWFIDYPEGTLYLVSGNVKFFDKKSSNLQHKKLILCTDKHHKYYKIPSIFIPLQRCNHNDIGGASTSQALWGYHMILSTSKFLMSKSQIGDISIMVFLTHLYLRGQNIGYTPN